MLSQWASVRLPWPRFRRPPCDPGWRVFPDPVLTLAFPSPPVHEVRNVAADPDHASHSRGLLRSSFSFKDTVLLAQSPGPVRNRQVPRVPSPASGVTSGGEASTPPRWALPHRPRYYELMCQSRPLPPPRFWALHGRSLQVAVSPCGERDFPDVISANPSSDAWTPTPVVPKVHVLVSSLEASAFPELKAGRHSTTVRTATSVRRLISGLQSFTHVQASKFARPPDRSHRRGSNALWAAGASTLEQHTTRYLLVCRVC